MAGSCTATCQRGLLRRAEIDSSLCKDNKITCCIPHEYGCTCTLFGDNY